MVEKRRNSSIEFLKIIAMFFIIISHVVQTYGMDHSLIGLSNKYFIDIELCSANLENLIMSCLRYLGALGNDIFFIASAWFLIDNKKNNFSKIINIVIDTWIISILFFIVFKICGVSIGKQDMIKSLFPTITSANWYVTCYILFYIIHQGLNKIIESLNQKQLFWFDIFLIITYGVICTLESDLLFFNYLIQFIFIYFIIAYVKKYMINTISSKKNNVIILACSTILLLSLIIITNYLGLKIPILHNKVLHWANGNNILIILIALSLFNIFRNKTSYKKIVNDVSKQTLFIYIIHENILFRTYIRPYIFVQIYEIFGYKYIIAWIMIISIILFVLSCIISLVYSSSIKRITKKISDVLDKKIRIIGNKVEKMVLKIN